MDTGMPPVISRFDGPWGWLSNFHPVNVTIRSEATGNYYRFLSVESAYQAMKTDDEQRWVEFAHLTPGQAKRHGRALALRPNWDSIKLSVMQRLLALKFRHPELRRLLLATGDAELIEGNNWGDRYWGVSGGSGENHLGRLLMDLRAELREKEV